MNDETNNAEVSSETNATESVVPAGMIAVALKYNFRRFPDTPANREAQIPSVEGREIQVATEFKKDSEGNDTDEVVFKRATETYNLLLPTPEALGFTFAADNEDSKKQAKVLQSMISTLVEQYGRALVNAGQVLTADNCSWELAANAEHDRLQKQGTSAGGVTYGKDLLEDIAESFSDYLKSIDKPEDGIKAMSKMITGRFGVLSTRKYIKGLDLVRANLEGWYAQHLTEQEQLDNKEVTIYLLERLEAAKEPEEIETGNLF